jgi:hypothetical protein
VIRDEIDRRQLETHPEDHQLAPVRVPQEHREQAPYWVDLRAGEHYQYEDPSERGEGLI